MEIQDYAGVLRKRWFSIVLLTAVGFALSTLFVLHSTKQYTSSAQIFVAAASSDSTTSLNSGNTFVEARVQSYIEVVNSPDVTNAVVKKLRLGISPDQLAGKISADAPVNKVILNIHVTDHSPTLAAKYANAVATEFVQYVEQIEQTSAGVASSPVKLTVIHPAQVPSSATSPNIELDLAIGFIVGLLLGIALAVVRETVDTRVRSADDLSAVTELPLLASIPKDRKSSNTTNGFRRIERGPRAEAIRQLRVNLQYIAVDSPPKVIAITSASSGEGKSTTSLNLAVALADAGKSVCIVDADMRRPSLAEYLQIPSGAGLTSLLAGTAAEADVIQRVGSNLDAIVSGPLPPNPSELIASTQYRNAMSSLASKYDYVIVDTAPLLPVADGRQVASAADTTLLVVQASQTNRDQVRKAIEALIRVDARLAGVVLNMTSRGEADYYDQRYTEPVSAAAPKLDRSEVGQSS